MLDVVGSAVCSLRAGQVVEFQGRWHRVNGIYEIEDWAYELTLCPPISERSEDPKPYDSGKEGWKDLPEYYDGTQFRIVISPAARLPRLPKAYARLRAKGEAPTQEAA